MNREEVRDEILKMGNPNILCELPTSFGKSRIAIELMGNRVTTDSKILIVIPRNVLIENWKDEFIKWGYERYLPCVTFVTYVSFPKRAGEWDFVIFDECFKGSTEVLTDNGFKRFDSLTGDEKIAQFNKDSSIEFVKPIKFIKKYHTGELCKLSLGRGRSVYMTPNHNQVYRTKADTEWKLKPIKDLSLKGYTSIPVSGLSKENGDSLSWMEKLLIAIQADGTLQRHQVNESVYSIHVTKQRKKDRLHLILDHLNNYTTIKGREGVDRYMVKLPKGDAKLLSTHFSVEMGITKARQFIEEVVKWDGSESMGNTLYYSSKIKENVDFVNAVAVQAGYKVLQSIEEDNRSENYSTIYRLYMRKETLEVHSHMNKEYIPYSGYVYCVEVPSHMIVVRSEGYTFISGNCHHLSERCRDSLIYFTIHNSVLLSATVKRDLKAILRYLFKDLGIYKVHIKEATEEGILPDPRVYLIPLSLDNEHVTHTIVKNKSKGNAVTISYAERWKWNNVKNRKIVIQCTQKQYYDDMSALIEWYRKKMFTEIFKNMFLRKSGERLKWLSDQKTPFIKLLLDKLRKERTLTFCNGIPHTEELGTYCINSKNKNSQEILDAFNDETIDHITACNILDEGMNLYNCRVGIYATLNSSERMIKQKLGRLLRHEDPVIIIPYYVGTRDEEIVKRMCEDYNPDLITTINDLTELKL